MVVILCLPQSAPVNQLSNLNYSGPALGAVLLYALVSWHFSARHWYRVGITERLEAPTQPGEKPAGCIIGQTAKSVPGAGVINPLRTSHTEMSGSGLKTKLISTDEL